MKQQKLDLKENDQEFTFSRRNVLKVSEIEKSGFVWTRVPANVTEHGDPYITVTYNMGIYQNIDHQEIPEEYKEKVIQKMREIKMKYVNQVYFGEIFIDPNYCGQLRNRWNHIFARGYCIKN